MSDVAQTRRVTLFYQQTSQRVNIDTAAITWGELKRQISGDIDKKRFVLRESKHTLQSEEAALPAGNFFIFVYPEESKGGAPGKKKKAVKKTAKKAAKKTAKKTAKKAVKKKAAKKVKPRVSRKPANPTAEVADVVNDVKVSKEEDEQTRLQREENERKGREVREREEKERQEREEKERLEKEELDRKKAAEKAEIDELSAEAGALKKTFK